MPIEYYSNNGNLNDPIISQSALGYLDPEMGGHPTKFARFINSADESKITPSLERGDLLHRWLEKPDEFIFADIEKPSEQLEKFSNSFYELYVNKLYEITEGFTEFCQSKISLDASDYIKINKIYQELNETSEVNQDNIKLLIYSILFSRQQAKVDKRLTDTKVIEKFEQCIPYIKFLKKATGKIAVTNQTKNILINCYESLKSHPIAKELLFEQSSSIIKRQKELELSWKELHLETLVRRKARLDQVDKTISHIRIIDTKTTAKDVSLFKEGAFKQWKLGRQLASYGLGYQAANPSNYRQFEYINIVVQTTEPYPTAVYMITEDTIQKSINDYNNIMSRLVHHIKTQNWEITQEEYENNGIWI